MNNIWFGEVYFLQLLRKLYDFSSLNGFDMNIYIYGFPWWLRGLSICLQCGRPGFNPWVRKIPWKRKWQPTPIFLPGESYGQRSLVGYSPWGRRVRHDWVTSLSLYIYVCMCVCVCIYIYIYDTVETVSDFIFLGSKITADGDCSHQIKRRLLLGRKVITNLDSIFKSRDITLPTKVRLVKAMIFPVVMYGCESWTVKKT